MFNFDSKSSAAADTENSDLSELIALASRLTPISELNEANRVTICKSATIANVNRTTALAANKEHRWFTYILEGQVEVRNSKDKEETDVVDANTNRALQPVLKEFTQHHSINTKTTATLVRFGQELFEILLNEQQKNATKAHDVRVYEKDNVAFDSIVEAFEQRAVNLSCQDEIGKKIASIVSQSSMGIPELSLALAADPALTAHTMHEANKLTAGETTQTIRGAITRLGVESVKQLAAKIPADQPWQAANPAIEQHMANYQRRSTLTAAICKVFAKSVPHLTDERAHLIGRMADIGELMVIDHANKNPEVFTDVESLAESSRNLRVAVGSWLLGAWGFNESFIEAAESARDFYRNHTGEITYADLVTAALLTIESELPEGENKSVPSVVNLLLPRKLQQAGIDLQNPQQILEEAAAELVELQKILQK